MSAIASGGGVVWVAVAYQVINDERDRPSVADLYENNYYMGENAERDARENSLELEASFAGEGDVALALYRVTIRDRQHIDELVTGSVFEEHTGDMRTPVLATEAVEFHYGWALDCVEVVFENDIALALRQSYASWLKSQDD